MKKFLLGFGLLLLVALSGGYVALAGIGYQGSAYAAKNLCSGVFVSKMPAETIMQQAVIPASPPLALASYTIDSETATASASMLGLFPRKAQYRAGLGCTLIPRAQDSLPKISLQPPSLKIDSELAINLDNPAIDYDLLQQAVDFAFAENDPRGNKNTKALVVMFNGDVVAERYADNVNAQTPLLGWSMTKSVTNMLVGILVKQNKLDIYQPAPVKEWQNDERRAITINDLLHMSSGLAFNETYGMATDVTQMLTAELDSGAFAASKPLIHPPGEFWDYSSGTTNIIARIIQQTVGGSVQSMVELAQRELFQPLDIQTAHFEPDPSGVLVGSSFLYMSGRDWAKLGQLMLSRGVWNDQHIISESWVNYSITPAPANPTNEYGAHFWLNRDPSNNAVKRTWPDVSPDAFSMNGYQGQHVVIIPSKKLVVVRLGFTPRPARPGMNEVLAKVTAAIRRVN